MASLFADFHPPKATDRRSLPPHLRQFIVDRHTEYPAFTPHELATLCYIASGRRPSSHTIKRVLATGPKPPSISRRYPRYHQMEPADRRLAIIRLHAEGWTVTSIAAYLETNRPRVYETLRRWVEEGVAGLENKPPVPKHPKRKVDLHVINEVRKLQKNPELGEFRIHATLLQIGIKLSPRTCGRILALNCSLYKDLERPETEPREPRPMPFQAARRHQYWTVDIRHLDMHELGGGMIYCITALENFSRAILASALSRTKDLTAYLMVLYAAIRQRGSPEAPVSDSDAIFKAKEAMRIYAALGVRKEQIDKRQPWQSHIEAHFNVERRMADWH
jgi:transposase InsO family protein